MGKEPAEAAKLLEDAAAIAEHLEERLITETRRNLGRVHLKRNELERARASSAPCRWPRSSGASTPSVSPSWRSPSCTP